MSEDQTKKSQYLNFVILPFLDEVIRITVTQTQLH